MQWDAGQGPPPPEAHRPRRPLELGPPGRAVDGPLSRVAEPQGREPPLEAGGGDHAVRGRAERLEVATGALAEAAGEVVRTGTLAPEHPAVGVQEQGDRAVGDGPFEDPKAVGSRLVRDQVDLAAFD